MRKLLIFIALFGLLPSPASAHRLDEYLQATILSIDEGSITGSMRLVPGVAVANRVIATIDANHDGKLSDLEQQAYAQRVLADLLLKADSRPLVLHLVSETFPSVAEMTQGTGEIQIAWTAELPSSSGRRKLTFENHHLSGLSVYLVNCLVPRNKSIVINAQERNENQSLYTLEFAQDGAGHTALPGFSGFAGSFRLGVRHIAEGTDHLLFLFALLLAAPLLASAGRWNRRASIGVSLKQVVRIVTCFTLGHSLTLALAAFGLVRLPSRPVEVLIAVSILVSAVHAIRPLLPGREAWMAAFFGLIHGLAFASALSELGVSGWYRLVSLVGFNLGIESMQLAVVAAVLPSLLMLSRTSTYSVFRLCGALFAAIASLGWIVERSFGLPSAVDPLIANIAYHGLLIAACLFCGSVLCFLLLRAQQESADYHQPLALD